MLFEYLIVRALVKVPVKNMSKAFFCGWRECKAYKGALRHPGRPSARRAPVPPGRRRAPSRGLPAGAGRPTAGRAGDREMVELEPFEPRLCSFACCSPAGAADAEGESDVVAHGQVREQQEVLEHDPDPSQLGWPTAARC